MTIISVLQFQLAQILDLLERDLYEGLVTYNFLICEDDFKLLSLYELQEYLTEKDIKNFLFLKEINKKCNDIIKIWNEDFKNLPDRKLHKPFVYDNPEMGKHFSSQSDFHAVYLLADKWCRFISPIDKKDFVANRNYNIYSIPRIAKKCGLILNMITACYPQTKDFENVYVKKDDNKKNILSNHRFTDTSFFSLRGENIEEYFKVMYNRFLFDYSDEVYLNGNLLTDDEKKLIKASFYNISKPAELITSNTLRGSELNEKRFVQYEIESIQAVKHVSLGKKLNLEDYKQYLEDLAKDLERADIHKDVDGWLTWMAKNPELAKKNILTWPMK